MGSWVFISHASILRNACKPSIFVYARQWPSTPGYWTVIRPSLKKEIALPRQVRDSSLETRTARSRLKTRHKPYFRLIEPGLHIGYRKLSSGPGTWVVRRYRGRGAYTVENLRTRNSQLVIADDYAEPNGATVISFAQAQNATRAKRARQEQATGSYTVGDAMDDYLRFLASDGRSKHAIYDAQRRDQGLIRPKLGDAKLSALTADRPVAGATSWRVPRPGCGQGKVKNKNTASRSARTTRSGRGEHQQTGPGRCFALRSTMPSTTA